MISVRDLVVRFAPGAPAVVQGVSFEVERGAAFGLVGESGCGKTTVLRAIAGLNRQIEGAILLDGAPLPIPRPRASFRRVQMVFQDPYGSLHPRQTILAQVMEPLRNQGIGDRRAKATAALGAVGLGDRFAGRFPHELSGGQRQRVAIARAMVLEPEVLLLDEPTSALDVSVQAEILNLLTDLREQRGLTCLLVSHDLGVVAHMCSRIAVMQAGRIVEQLDVDTLCSGLPAHPYTRQLLAANETYGMARVIERA